MHTVTTATGYCHYCILAYINVHSERLTKQRKIKQKQAQEPMREVKKTGRSCMYATVCKLSSQGPRNETTVCTQWQVKPLYGPS